MPDEPTFAIPPYVLDPYPSRTTLPSFAVMDHFVGSLRWPMGLQVTVRKRYGYRRPRDLELHLVIQTPDVHTGKIEPLQRVNLISAGSLEMMRDEWKSILVGVIEQAFISMMRHEFAEFVGEPWRKDPHA